MRFIFRARSIYENMLRNFYYHFVGIDILRGYEFYPRGILRDK